MGMRKGGACCAVVLFASSLSCEPMISKKWLAGIGAGIIVCSLCLSGYAVYRMRVSDAAVAIATERMVHQQEQMDALGHRCATLEEQIGELSAIEKLMSKKMHEYGERIGASDARMHAVRHSLNDYRHQSKMDARVIIDRFAQLTADVAPLVLSSKKDAQGRS